MKNEVEISTDQINVYITLKVKANNIGKMLLIGFILLGLSFFVGLLLNTEPEGASEFVFSFIVFVLIAFFVLKYLLWNMYGAEEIIINTKTVSYCYDYGFFKTNLKTLHFHHLGTGYEPIMYVGSTEELGKLHLYNYLRETNLPASIFETTVLISKEKVNEIDNMIRSVFIKELNNDFRFIPYSLN